MMMERKNISRRVIRTGCVIVLTTLALFCFGTSYCLGCRPSYTYGEGAIPIRHAHMQNATALSPQFTTKPACYTPLQIPNIRLKDHTLFQYDGTYYIISTSINLPTTDERGEYHFYGARTNDFCTWEHMGNVLSYGETGDADEAYVWAPYVIEEQGTFFLFYTGVNQHIAQSIMLATSTNPANPQSWVKHGVVFQPNHPGMVYDGSEAWSDARDPMVLRYNNHYFLYYTGKDQEGGIVGVAMAENLQGPWRDLGAVLTISHPMMPESPFVLEHNGYFYLYTHASNTQPPWHSAQYWQWAPSPFGPWQPAVQEYVGWGHDFYFDTNTWLASYLIGNGDAIGIEAVQWNTNTQPPQPMLGNKLFLPCVVSAIHAQ